jgi:hypothetical protein
VLYVAIVVGSFVVAVGMAIGLAFMVGFLETREKNPLDWLDAAIQQAADFGERVGRNRRG